VKRLGDELASALNRLDRAERLNLILGNSVRSANEEAARLMTLLGI
jgi:thiamine pyrophosphate-dependent acetolactate synthase large subunit-like protein